LLDSLNIFLDEFLNAYCTVSKFREVYVNFLNMKYIFSTSNANDENKSLHAITIGKQRGVKVSKLDFSIKLKMSIVLFMDYLTNEKFGPFS
jgi:hypothetical protein